MSSLISEKTEQNSIFSKKLYLNFAEYIVSCQDKEGGIHWEPQAKIDPWDHIEAAMGLDVLGFQKNSKQAYIWLEKNQESDGSWFSSYYDENENLRKETNFVSYIACGMWHHYLNYQDKKFLREFWPILDAAIEFCLSGQTEYGDILWAKDAQDAWMDDSLLTGCSSIYKSLDCYKAIAREINANDRVTEDQIEGLKNCILNNKDRFDRNWKSKDRYSMDWYYPILCGILDQKSAKKLIREKWEEFVVDGLGCKCVREEPWVTAAESSELVLGLIRIGMNKQAQEILQNTFNLIDKKDSLLWTGYVYKDDKFWPVEKPSWTAGAAILAGNAINKFSPSWNFFNQEFFLT